MSCFISPENLIMCIDISTLAILKRCELRFCKMLHARVYTCTQKAEMQS